MFTMSLRLEAEIYCLIHTWYINAEFEIEDLDNSGTVEFLISLPFLLQHPKMFDSAGWISDRLSRSISPG